MPNLWSDRQSNAGARLGGWEAQPCKVAGGSWIGRPGRHMCLLALCPARPSLLPRSLLLSRAHEARSSGIRARKPGPAVPWVRKLPRMGVPTRKCWLLQAAQAGLQHQPSTPRCSPHTSAHSAWPPARPPACSTRRLRLPHAPLPAALLPPPHPSLPTRTSATRTPRLRRSSQQTPQCRRTSSFKPSAAARQARRRHSSVRPLALNADGLGTGACSRGMQGSRRARRCPHVVRAMQQARGVDQRCSSPPRPTPRSRLPSRGHVARLPRRMPFLCCQGAAARVRAAAAARGRRAA